jgi:putative DNA methylase
MHRPTTARHASAPTATLLERAFPFAAVSAVALADRNSRDPVYSAHKWWARRPPAVIRALLLAASLSPDTDVEAFWAAYGDPGAFLAGRHVADPFMGGATTIVEASRLGASVTGIDVDPLAVRIARQELAGVDVGRLRTVRDELLEHLDAETGHLFGAPLHFFFLREVVCGSCRELSLLYRDLVLARDARKPGAVVRSTEVYVFCPACRSLHELSASDDALVCCGRAWPLCEGTYRLNRFHCPACDESAAHHELRTASAARVLIAVEETQADGPRRLRAPRPAEDGVDAAHQWWSSRDLTVPAARLGAGETARARRYGFERVSDLFSGRQLALFASAFAWIDSVDLEDGVADALRLAVSNALSSNNLLTGYATDYGRLAPLFTGVRAYSMPVLAVELNPLHRTGGRGTLVATLRRLEHTEVETVRRHSYDPVTSAVKSHDFVARRPGPARLACRSADRGLPNDLGPVDIALSDPPYFDYISYSDLSLFFRAWHGAGSRAEGLAGAPIYPIGSDGGTTFRTRLALSFGKVRAALADDGVFCFTFHASTEAAWDAIGAAVRDAGLRVTTAFPVWADARAASHSHAGNCEWDVVLVCRRADGPVRSALPRDVSAWLAELGRFTVSDADRRNLALGLRAAKAAA